MRGEQFDNDGGHDEVELSCVPFPDGRGWNSLSKKMMRSSCKRSSLRPRPRWCGLGLNEHNWAALGREEWDWLKRVMWEWE